MPFFIREILNQKLLKHSYLNYIVSQNFKFDFSSELRFKKKEVKASSSLLKLRFKASWKKNLLNRFLLFTSSYNISSFIK